MRVKHLDVFETFHQCSKSRSVTELFINNSLNYLPSKLTEHTLDVFVRIRLFSRVNFPYTESILWKILLVWSSKIVTTVRKEFD